MSGRRSAFREEIHLNAHLFDVLGEQFANEGLGMRGWKSAFREESSKKMGKPA